jgi:hypothetical protein
MEPGTPTREDKVEQARQHVQDVMRQHSDDPRSQQLIDEALREANLALRAARAELEQAERA